MLGFIGAWRSNLKIWWAASALAATSMLVVGGTSAKELVGAGEIDQAVILKLSSLYGINSNVIAHVDLTKQFDTTSQWTLVVGKQPDKESTVRDALDEPVGAVSVCFVKNATPDCSEAMFPAKDIALNPAERPFYQLYASEVVYSGRGKTRPLLMIKAGSWSGADGSHGIFTSLFDYDRRADKFRAVFFNGTGSNNNQETRFVQTGPLLGAVIVADPIGDAPSSRANPYAYSVEVYRRDAAGRYARVLAYRGRTSYGDGNPLAVIDSEMPETLRRLGLWKRGEPLPIPERIPPGCVRFVMRKGAEWCE